MATAEIYAPPLSTNIPATPFVNEPIKDFSLEENVRPMRRALEKVRAELDREYDLIIGGQLLKTKEKIVSRNPARPSEVVGTHQKAGAEHVESAMQAALTAFESWSRTPVEQRASIIFRASQIIKERRFEFDAWLVYEVGKNWTEADADIAETIDFME